MSRSSGPARRADRAVPRRQPQKKQKPRQTARLPAPAVKGPLIIAISIANQRLTVFDDGRPIAQAPVSTGMPGHSTPMGVFSVNGKARFHRSNLYAGAPMPFMQRITWSGVALHAGVLPGYPASHGCIRMPYDFAGKLYEMTRLGARVVITRNEVTPVEIEHARRVALKQIDAPLARTSDLRPSIDLVVAGRKTADASMANGGASDNARPGRDGAEVNGNEAVASDAAPVSPAMPGEVAPGQDAPNQAMPNQAMPSVPTTQAPSGQPASDAGAVGGPEAAVVAAKDPATVPGSLSATAALPLDKVFVPPARPARSLRTGPVSVFVSRAEGRLYVRKGFEPLFSAPVSIARPDQPIGTHVFTATEPASDASLRWTAVSLQPDGNGKAEARGRRDPTPAVVPSSSAAEALDRIDLSPALNGQISSLLSVGASLIISDQGLGRETGLETDFIVVMPTDRTGRPRGSRKTVPAPRKTSRGATTFWQ